VELSWEGKDCLVAMCRGMAWLACPEGWCACRLGLLDASCDFLAVFVTVDVPPPSSGCSCTVVDTYGLSSCGTIANCTPAQAVDVHARPYRAEPVCAHSQSE
jgi:hypothetical protein